MHARTTTAGKICDRFCKSLAATALAGAMASAAALPASGTVSVTPYFGPGSQYGQFGPADSASGDEALLVRTLADWPGNYTASSKANGDLYVSAATEFVRPDAETGPTVAAGWSGIFTNALAHADHFVVDIKIDHDFETQFIDPVLDPPYYVGWSSGGFAASEQRLFYSYTYYDELLGEWDVMGATMPSTPGHYTLPIGILQPGQSSTVHFDLSAWVRGATNRVEVCRSDEIPGSSCPYMLGARLIATDTVSLSVLAIRPVPEPAAWMLSGLGLAGLAGLRRIRQG